MIVRENIASACEQLRENTRRLHDGEITIDQWADEVARIILTVEPDASQPRPSRRSAQEALARVARTNNATTSR